MKTYTTPEVSMRLDGSELLIQAADDVRVAICKDNEQLVLIGRDRLTIDGDKLSFRLTTQETAELAGICKVEATLFCGDLVYKSKTMNMTVRDALWDNGGSDA